MKRKELYRSRNKKVIGGVCGGIGEFLDTDPTIVRLVWVIMTVMSIWVGVAGYLLAWMIIPNKPFAEKANRKKKRKR